MKNPIKNTLYGIVLAGALNTNVFAESNFKGVQLAEKEGIIGRIQRTERFNNIIERVENKYNIPKHTLYAIIMQESYGDPVQPNRKGDGGLGLIHFQGSTAKEWGLDIYGKSKSSKDFKHGKQIKNLIKKCKSNLECIAKYDDRANPEKNLDAAARYLINSYKKTKDWDLAIESIHTGLGKIGTNRGYNYLTKIKNFREKSLDERYMKKSKKDFNYRNLECINRKRCKGINWNTYINTFKNKYK